LPLSGVSDQLISRYIDQFHKRITLARPYGQRSKLAHGLGHLLVVLRQAGVVVAAKQIPSPTEQWLARYDQYLNQVGGKAAATRKKYLSYARRFWEKTKPNELRNTAVLSLLARLGLRAGEVARYVWKIFTGLKGGC
jgi:integrase